MTPGSDKKTSKNLLIAAFIFLVTVFCIGLSVYTAISSLSVNQFFYFGGFSNQPLIYEKDDGIYINKIGENTSYKLTNSSCIKSQFSKDGKRIFLLCDDKLLYINFNNMNFDDISSSVTTIDTGVTDFVCSRDGRYNAYKKGNSLYILKTDGTSSLLSNNVFDDCFINEEDGNIVYTVYKSDLCVYDIDKENIIRTKNVNYYKFYNNNSQKLYFLSAGNLYYKEKDTEPIRISRGMSNLISVDTEIFVLSKTTDTFSLYKVQGKEIRLIDSKILEISNDFGTHLIYKKKTAQGFETYGLNKKGQTFKLFDKNSSASNYTITKKGDAVYAVIDYKTEPSMLVKYTLTSGGVSERKIIADNIFNYYIVDNEQIIYSHPDGEFLYDNNKSTLLSKYDISNSICINNSIYMTESADGENFNILRAKNGSVQFLAENTSGEFDALTSSDIVYIKNKELYLKHGTDECKLIDNNVKCIIKTTKYE